MSFVAVAIGVSTAVGIGTAAYAAQERNKQVKRSYRANQLAAEGEQQQQARINELQRKRSRREAERAFGIIAVSAAERGVGFSGSVDALDRNIAIEETLNENALDIERYGAERRTLAGLNITNLGLKAQGQSIALAGLTGGIQGASTGLSIGQGIQSLSR